MVTLYPRIWTYNYCLHGPSELNILQIGTEIELLTSKMGIVLSEFDIKLVHVPGTKMIQSDALSRRLDFGPEKDQDNKDRILLSEDMFVNLMDVDLQDHIANMDKYNYDVKMALELLLENGPNSLQQDLKDWKLEKHGEKKIYFIRTRTIFQTIWKYGGTSSKCSMITRQQDIHGNWKLIILSDNIIGGWGCKPLSSNMCRVVEFVNNSR